MLDVELVLTSLMLSISQINMITFVFSDFQNVVKLGEGTYAEVFNIASVSGDEVAVKVSLFNYKNQKRCMTYR